MKLSIAELYNSFMESTGVCTDTRSLQHGQIFFALKGPNFNGNAYAEKAVSEGALLAVIDEVNFESSDRFVLVDNVLETLQLLANYHRKQFSIPFFGITGSNGKTTTKEITARVLSKKYKVHYTQGNLNNHIGVPLTLLSIPEDTEFAIIEMGANHVGDIAELCSIAEPTHGLITNIGDAHIGEFGGKENLIRGKSELFDFLRLNDGIPFINTEDTVLNNMSKRFANSISYPNANSTFKSAVPFVHYRDINGKEHRTEMIGAYNFLNIAAAATIGNYFGVDYPYDEIDKYLPDNNRSQVIDLGSNKIVLDAYNANPSSMIAALENLETMSGVTKIALLGEMKELGEYTALEHRKIVELAHEKGIDAYWVGRNYADIVDENGKSFEKVEKLIAHFEENPLKEATVLIKGSRSTKMEKLTQSKQIWI
ncbi:UDP-N-acetylmuramoyl-tripeptide--D-alanyl-D-alanine ligase [Reichenbachiella versicolor]|uniref:UDP-N-acetylmuramoyl-tripeptide--D-alanyl-D- alanine ligase n=1 Tax=Reichenbachiella versicolor TaxID=1821036 RepID=UPI001FE379A2|nr:UDP-N-acetylmuramoyl-tripeptide--D-alanyl-D-alanine ligase [Reichenbachiella versicolor]